MQCSPRHSNKDIFCGGRSYSCKFSLWKDKGFDSWNSLWKVGQMKLWLSPAGPPALHWESLLSKDIVTQLKAIFRTVVLCSTLLEFRFGTAFIPSWAVNWCNSQGPITPGPEIPAGRLATCAGVAGQGQGVGAAAAILFSSVCDSTFSQIRRVISLWVESIGIGPYIFCRYDVFGLSEATWAAE